MAVYGVVGKLGTGKTKFAVYQARNALLEGRRVASNVDLKPWLMNKYRKRTYIRLPDKPTAFDLDAIGHGNPDSYDEDKNGVLILDELGTWLNTRSFQDKGRAAVIDWMIHARKLGWDVYLIVQDEGMIDKQVREALIEYQCRCMNLSKVKLPFVGGILGLFKKQWGYLPKMHTVTARTGYGQNAIIAEKWLYRGTELHECYDTRQIFKSDYPHGSHSVLPPWDWQPEKLPGDVFRERLDAIKKHVFAPPSQNAPKPQPKPRPRALDLIAQMDVPPEIKIKYAKRYLDGFNRSLPLTK